MIWCNYIVDYPGNHGAVAPVYDLSEIDLVESPLAHRLRRSIASLSSDLFDDEIPPTDRAVEACVKKLIATATRFTPASAFVPPQFTTVGDGGLSCEWPGDAKRIVLSVSRDGESRLSTYERTIDGGLRVDHVVRPGGHDLERAIRPYLGSLAVSP